MTEYKNTLNLPKTSFSMKANLTNREPEMLRFWQDLDLYNKLCEKKASKQFILHDGPPYANGSLHQGHALNKILKDIVVKSKFLSGYNSPYVPGWDCHGLPIGVNVEKKIGKVSKEEFVRACRKYAALKIDLQREGFKRLGVFGEWDNPYLTMDFKYEADVIRALGKIIQNGHLVYGKKPVYWCTDCGSALAEAEVEYKEKTSPAIDVRFRVVTKNDFIKQFDFDIEAITIPIWTTTPWTLPANQAVAVNPKFEYMLVKTVPEYLIVAKDLLKEVMQRFSIDTYRVVATFPGEKLAGIKVQHPFLERQVPIVLGDHVTMDAGTGAVHTAPGHGQDDYVIGSRYGLLIENPVDNKGCFLPNTEFFAGEHVFKANDHVIEVLKERNNLIYVETITHSYPHCWRHKLPLIFRATPQWFISMDKNDLRQRVIAEINKVIWLPDWGKARIKAMVKQRPDWCISRQRVWGTPMPLFIHKESGELHPQTVELIEKAAAKVEQHGIEAWFELDAQELLGAQAKDYEKINDTLDVWFDAGVSHTCVLKKREELGFPADLYLEGSDQHRGWFQSSLLTSVAMYGCAPYKTVLTHGHVLDAHGRKMSKSLGNVVSPEKITKSMGADILRLWVASMDYSADINCSDESLKRTSDAYRRLRNTARFLLSNLDDFDFNNHAIVPEKMLALDLWAVDSARLLQQEILAAYEKYQFYIIYQKLYNFCTVNMGSFYLDIIKDRQYTTQADSLARRSAQTAMYYILQALVRWLAPILSFTAEEIWQHMNDKVAASIFLTTWYENLPSLPQNTTMNQDYWHLLMRVRDEVNKELERQRAASNIGSALDADVVLYCDGDSAKKLKLLGNELRFVFITASAAVLAKDARPQDAVTTDIHDLWLRASVSPHPKCIRCWHHREDVGSSTKHPEICSRCIENVDGKGEDRLYA